VDSTPLKNDGVRQLGLLFPTEWKVYHKIPWFQTTNMDFSIFAPAMDFSGVLATFRSWHGSGDRSLNGGSGSHRTSEPTGPAAVVLDRQPRGSMVVLWSVTFIGGWSDLLGLKHTKDYGKIQKITIFNG
jgi:hypothetical protein